MQCDDGDIQLLMGETSGPVEVCVNKRWATVCYDGWSDVDAAVACRQLGYDSGKNVHYTTMYNLHTAQFLVQCKSVKQQ